MALLRVQGGYVGRALAVGGGSGPSEAGVMIEKARRSGWGVQKKN